MNRLNYYFGFLIILSFSISHAQEVHRIKMLVDTKNAAPEKAIQWSASENTKILDSGEQGPFTIFAQVGDQIQWEVVSLTEPEVTIHLESLHYIKGPRIFSKNIIRGKPDTRATVIRGGTDYYNYQWQIRFGDRAEVYNILSRIRVGD
ncbi:MAG: hypothetical protein KJO86_05465 [Muriicola sp.]|nr:hypothetical protein [Muriicola sp.]